ncbi:hypothetical protein B0H11DRAFT_1912379 [Mycena galericulata]|nr:hypothetical protein B0H11DRAFT_1912379 [Mycena galericulata]
MDNITIIHKIQSFILDNGYVKHFAVPHKFKFTRLPLPKSWRTLQPSTVIGKRRCESQWVPVLAGNCQFTPRTIFPPLKAKDAHLLVRTSTRGAPSPSWIPEFDNMLACETAPEPLLKDCLLGVTIPEKAFPIVQPYERRQHLVVEVLTDGVVGRDGRIRVPFCSAESMVVVTLLQRVAGFCLLECRHDNAEEEPRIVIRIPEEHVDLASFQTLHHVIRRVQRDIKWAAKWTTQPLCFAFLRAKLRPKDSNFNSTAAIPLHLVPPPFLS